MDSKLSVSRVVRLTFQGGTLARIQRGWTSSQIQLVPEPMLTGISCPAESGNKLRHNSLDAYELRAHQAAHKEIRFGAMSGDEAMVNSPRLGVPSSSSAFAKASLTPSRSTGALPRAVQ